MEPRWEAGAEGPAKPAEAGAWVAAVRISGSPGGKAHKTPRPLLKYKDSIIFEQLALHMN